MRVPAIRHHVRVGLARDPSAPMRLNGLDGGWLGLQEAEMRIGVFLRAEAKSVMWGLKSLALFAQPVDGMPLGFGRFMA